MYHTVPAKRGIITQIFIGGTLTKLFENMDAPVVVVVVRGGWSGSWWVLQWNKVQKWEATGGGGGRQQLGQAGRVPPQPSSKPPSPDRSKTLNYTRPPRIKNWEFTRDPTELTAIKYNQRKPKESNSNINPPSDIKDPLSPDSTSKLSHVRKPLRHPLQHHLRGSPPPPAQGNKLGNEHVPTESKLYIR